MKKKLSLMLTVLLSICMLCACGEDPKNVDYKGKSYSDLSGEAVSNAYFVAHMAQAFADQGINVEDLTEKDIEALCSYNGCTEAQIDACTSWNEIESKYGECTQFDAEDFSLDSIDTTDIFEVDKAGNTLTSDLTLKFGKKDVIFEVVYDYYDMSVTSISINPVQTMSEKMTSAGQNTIISLSIVFLVLILISLIIKGFVIFPMIEEKKRNKKNKNESTEDKIEITSAPVETVAPVENPMDDTELVAVIAAAIAASEGTSTSDFVVRSINRR